MDCELFQEPNSSTSAVQAGFVTLRRGEVSDINLAMPLVLERRFPETFLLGLYPLQPWKGWVIRQSRIITPK